MRHEPARRDGYFAPRVRRRAHAAAHFRRRKSAQFRQRIERQNQDEISVNTLSQSYPTIFFKFF